MKLSEQIEKFRGMSVLQKTIAGIAGFFIILFIVREIFFFSIFNHVMSQVKAQNNAVEKRQASIMAQAQEMQQKMNDEENQFYADKAQIAEKITKNADDMTKSLQAAQGKVGSSLPDSKMDSRTIEMNKSMKEFNQHMKETLDEMKKND